MQVVAFGSVGKEGLKMSRLQLWKFLLLLSVACSGLASFVRRGEIMAFSAVGFGILAMISILIKEDSPKQKRIFVAASALAIFTGVMRFLFGRF